VRFSLTDFSPTGVQALNLGYYNGALHGFHGGFTDGKYAYLVPFEHYWGRHGMAPRIDLDDFTTNGVTMVDMGAIDPALKGFIGGFTDGRYAYYIPNSADGSPTGKMARIDLKNFSASGLSTVDLSSISNTLKGFVGGFTDGRYGYLAPGDNGVGLAVIARIDLNDFTTGGVSTLNLTDYDSSLTGGFFSGFSDGKFGYFVPFSNGASGKVVRMHLLAPPVVNGVGI
jgi:hypothetical protein